MVRLPPPRIHCPALVTWWERKWSEGEGESEGESERERKREKERDREKRQRDASRRFFGPRKPPPMGEEEGLLPQTLDKLL